MKFRDIIEALVVLCAVLFFFSSIVFIMTASIGIFFSNFGYITILSYSGFIAVNSLVLGVAIKAIHCVIYTVGEQ